MSRKTIIILIIIGALAVLGIGIYLLFFTTPGIQNTSTTPNNNSPFGNYSGSSTAPSNNVAVNTPSSQASSTYINSPSSPLIRISTAPIAGAEVIQNKIAGTTTTTNTVRYTERATGHTMEYDQTSGTLTNTSNTTIPTIYQAWWSGKNMLAQLVDQDKQTIKTFSGSLSTVSTSSPGTITGNFLPNNLYDLVVSPKGTRIFTIAAGDSAVGTISNIDGSKKSQIFSFPFNEWSASWPNEGTITLTTKASANVPGYFYFLSTSGTMTKIFGDVGGLATLTNPSLTYTLYSGNTTGGIQAAVYDLKKGDSFSLANTPTLAEKCVWSTLSKTTAYCAVPTNVPSGTYPDDWYQGNVSFTDNIYKIDMTLPSINLIYSLPLQQNIDATNLFLDAKEQTLYFTNKNDYSLWGLNLQGLMPTP